MPKRTARKTQVFVLLAGLMALLLGAGLANADVRDQLVAAIGAPDDPAAGQVEAEVEEPEVEEVQVVGQLEANHGAPDEVQAKLEDDPEEIDEEADDPSDDEDGANAAAVAPDPPADDQDTDTDDGKTSIPLPGAGDDTEGDDTDDAGDTDADEGGDDSGDEEQDD
jgi:hypothetical protein